MELFGTWRVDVVPVSTVDTFSFSISSIEIHRDICTGCSSSFPDNNGREWWKSVVDAVKGYMPKNLVEYTLRFSTIHRHGKPFVRQRLAMHRDVNQDEPSLKGAVLLLRRWVELSHAPNSLIPVDTVSISILDSVCYLRIPGTSCLYFSPVMSVSFAADLAIRSNHRLRLQPGRLGWSSGKTGLSITLALVRGPCCLRPLQDESLVLTTRFKLTFSSEASRASLRWTSGGTRTMNLPLCCVD